MELYTKTYQPKPVNFNLSIYLSKGFELFKKDIGNVILAYIFTMIMAIIPFCGVLGIGNFYKFCKKLENNEKPEATEIFNFDDFYIYFKLQLILICCIFAMYIPFLFLLPFIPKQGEEPSPMFGLVFFIIIALIVVIIFTSVCKIFYIQGLVSLKKIIDIKELWKVSNIMTKGNVWIIIFFSIIIGFLGQLGILFCVIGLFFTMPITFCMHYIAIKDGIDQIEYDEIKTIGSSES